ncbi:MAG: HAMP domain-containing protein [Deltaproteobacteria bacterium]|nr:MAG: HAMP domain-containing protein [Deltaproteobacteria bacterium]
MSDAPTWQGPTGFRVRLTLALVGVLALVVPQVVLTVNAMIHLYDGGGEVARLGVLGGRTEALAARVDTLLTSARGLPPDGLDGDVERLAHDLRVQLTGGIDASLAQDLAAALTAWRDVVVTVPAAPAIDGSIDLPAWLSALVRDREDILDRLTAWHAEHPDPDARESGTYVAWLEDRIAETAERLQLGALPYEMAGRGIAGAWIAGRSHRAAEAARLVRSGFRTLRRSIHDEMSEQAGGIKGEVDAANRYLVTLVLLTLVYVAALILVLPTRLVGPLRHLRAVMDRAAAGHVDAEARALGKDEVGQLGRALNALLRRVRTFDALKRDRIVQDREHIRRLLELVPGAYAILDPQHRIEHANRAFRKLFHLSEDFEDRSLLDLVAGDDLEEFAEILDDALTRRRGVDRMPLTLTSDAGPQVYHLSLEPARNRAGKISALRVRLDPAS